MRSMFGDLWRRLRPLAADDIRWIALRFALSLATGWHREPIPRAWCSPLTHWVSRSDLVEAVAELVAAPVAARVAGDAGAQAGPLAEQAALGVAAAARAGPGEQVQVAVAARARPEAL